MATTAQEARATASPTRSVERLATRPILDERASRSLATLVQAQIVPRLVLAHRRGPDLRGFLQAAEADLQVDSFTPLTLAHDPAPLFARVDALLDAGVAIDTVMIYLIAPAARLLGVWWEEDRCDFVEVTMGLWRLQEVVRELSTRTAPAPPRAGRRALFAAFPGDQHEFGTMLVNEAFVRDGWNSEMIVGADMGALLAAVAADAFDLVGLTISCDVHAARLSSAILALRSVSCNPRLRVMIGGRVPNEDVGLASRCSADGTAADAVQALRLAEALVDSGAHSAACC